MATLISKWLAIPVHTGGVLADLGVAFLLHEPLLVAVVALDSRLVAAVLAFASFSFVTGKLAGSFEGLSSGFSSLVVDHLDH
jgi:hypothetical protein